MFRRFFMLATVVLIVAFLHGATVAGQTPQKKDERIQIQKLIAQLNNAKFRVRAKAQMELLKLGPAVIPALKEAEQSSESLEVRLRLGEIVTMIQKARVAEITKAAKPAIALLEVTGRGFAARAGIAAVRQAAQSHVAAVCIHSSGLFLTDVKVQGAAAKNNNPKKLVLHPGTPMEKKVNVKFLLHDRGTGLALIQVDGKIEHPAVPLGRAEKLSELVEVALLSVSAAQGQVLSGPTAHSGLISSMHMSNGQLNQIEFDAEGDAFNGAATGIMLDLKGNLLGVGVALPPNRRVVAGAASGANVVIPVNVIRQFVAQPLISFTPPALKTKDIHKLIEFQAQLVHFFPIAKPMELKLVVFEGNIPRQYDMTLDKGIYKAKVIPLPAPKSEPKLDISVKFKDGRVLTQIPDRDITVGKQKLPLSQMRSLKVESGKVLATFADGKTGASTLSGLENVTVQIGGVPRKIAFSKATEITIQPPQTPANVECVVAAYQDGKMVAQVRGMMVIPR